MKAVAHWLRSHRGARLAVIVLAFLLPLANVVSAAVIVLTARGAGLRTAAIDVGASLVILVGLVHLANGETGSAALLTVVFSAGALWGGALLGGHLLRRFQSVDLAVQALVVAALLGVLAAGLAIPDARAHWQPILEAFIQTAGLPQADRLPAGWLGPLAALMHGVIGASLLSTLILALMLGLWLDQDPAGDDWRRRFLNLRLGRVLAVVTAAAALLLLGGFVSVGGGALLVLGTGFTAQGLAIVHWTADHRGWPRIWPLALYGPLLLGAPPAALLLMALAIAGLVDNGFSLRLPRSNVV